MHPAALLPATLTISLHHLIDVDPQATRFMLLGPWTNRQFLQHDDGLWRRQRNLTNPAALPYVCMYVCSVAAHGILSALCVRVRVIYVLAKMRATSRVL